MFVDKRNNVSHVNLVQPIFQKTQNCKKKMLRNMFGKSKLITEKILKTVVLALPTIISVKNSDTVFIIENTFLCFIRLKKNKTCYYLGVKLRLFCWQGTFTKIQTIQGLELCIANVRIRMNTMKIKVKPNFMALIIKSVNMMKVARILLNGVKILIHHIR